MKNSTNLEYIKENGDDETQIDGIFLIFLFNHNEYGEGYGDEDE